MLLMLLLLGVELLEMGRDRLEDLAKALKGLTQGIHLGGELRGLLRTLLQCRLPGLRINGERGQLQLAHALLELLRRLGRLLQALEVLTHVELEPG